MIENDVVYCNTMPKCEPQLGKRGLYAAVGGDKNTAAANLAMLWIFNLSDGKHSLLDIAERADLPFAAISSVARQLQQHGLLKCCATSPAETRFALRGAMISGQRSVIPELSNFRVLVYCRTTR